MKTINRLEGFALVLRVCLGAWFAFSGGQKLWVSGLDEFISDISNYGLLQRPWDAIAAYSVPWLELLAGFGLMLGLLLRGSILVLAGLVSGFCVFIGWAWWHRLNISCGCHGGDGSMQYWIKAIELPFYFVVLGFLWFMAGRRRIEQKTQNMA